MKNKAKILKVGYEKDDNFYGFEFDCGDMIPAIDIDDTGSYIAGYTKEELREIIKTPKEQEYAIYISRIRKNSRRGKA